MRYPGASAEAISDISTVLAAGDRVALVGESGSGKSTTGLAVGGLLPRDAEVTADRFAIDGRPQPLMAPGVLPRRRPDVSMVFQDAMTCLDPVSTIGTQLRTVLRDATGASRAEAKVRAAEWLRRVGLDDTVRVLGSRPYELSGGMRQRVMIAIALCSRPRLVIADEPTSALDASLARQAMGLLTDLVRESGAAMLMISHDIDLCAEFTDRVLVMYAGRIVEEVASERLHTAAAHPYTRGLLASVPTLAGAGAEWLSAIPAPTGESGGCDFRARCRYATDRCAELPPLEAGVRCWHTADVLAAPGAAAPAVPPPSLREISLEEVPA
ncbi:ABC transporter ATP-binding protein [Pseudonocardia pini]|uniref:ABC transporter ATP-binding protein n=1 Tax=Pseudonocardia pini TaxID=2758030 RepID=UPI0028ADC5C2|nr:ABC transporter ATP-binding protein [Pseudonocardia pini]